MFYPAIIEDMEFKTSLPTETHTKDHIYTGEVILAPGFPSSILLARTLQSLIKDELKVSDIRRAHETHDSVALHGKTSTLRQFVSQDSTIKNLVSSVVRDAGFREADWLLDSPQLRSLQPLGYLNTAAKPAYSGHRDTWFSYPQCMVNFWIGVTDLSAEYTFEFYPTKFKEPVTNNSKEFDYKAWSTKTGTATFTQNSETVNAPAYGFSVKEGEVLIFSGHHYHKTIEAETNKMRFSLDFRIVCKSDVQTSNGPKNVDNESGGFAIDRFAPIPSRKT